MEQELNEYLAEEIMGWELKEMWGKYLYIIEMEDNEYYPQYSKENWNPLENLEQAFEVLEEYNETWSLSTNPSDCYMCHFIPDKVSGNGISDTKPKAIIGAVLKAEGKFDEFKECF